MRPTTIVCQLVLTLAPLLFSNSATAATFKGGKISGYDLLLCGGGAFRKYFNDSNVGSYALGFGFRHYEEDSEFWTGSRKQWSVCGGSYVNRALGVDQRSSNEASTLPAGSFLAFEYFPWMYTLLPGRSFNPGLIFLPSYTVGAGFTGVLFQNPEFTYERRESSQSVSENHKPRTDLFLGPAIVFGSQVRLFAFEWSAQLQFGPSMNALTGQPDWTAFLTLSAGVFTVK